MGTEIKSADSEERAGVKRGDAPAAHALPMAYLTGARWTWPPDTEPLCEAIARAVNAEAEPGAAAPHGPSRAIARPGAGGGPPAADFTGSGSGGCAGYGIDLIWLLTHL